MKEILLTSSALILAILLLRLVFRNRISRRAQYALWLLVLARLLVPVSLPGVTFSLLTAAEPVGQAVTQRLEGQMVFRRPLESLPAEEAFENPNPALQPENTTSPSGEAAVPGGEASSAPKETYHFLPIVERVVTAADLLTYFWIAGMAVMAAWLLGTNLRFWRKLWKARIPYSAEGCKYPVYLVETGLSSPCLFGLARPAIYLTPAAAQTPERLRHVIAHESAHARHLDPLWALLRGVCLAVWWFNPLVWAAAIVSKADGELACDEAALAALGPAERLPYGQTLLSLIPVHRGPENPLLSATTMTAGKRQLKDRITRIAQGSQTRAAALFLVVGLAAVVCAVTFTGAKTGGTDAGETVPLTGDQLAYFNEEFFNNDTVNNVVGVNIHNQFLNSLYERPEDIDLYELFYCGTGRSEKMTEEELRQVGSFDESGSQICPTDKLAVSDLDAVLLENTGLTLAETAGIGLEQFQYLPEYDAYYHTHGDTNYFHSVRIVAGKRSGDTFRLYYPDNYARYTDCDWLCVTLERQSDGSFWFVSNQPAEKPAIPTVYPEGDPVLTIPLTDLAAYEPAPAPVERRANDCAEGEGGLGIEAEDGSQVSVSTYLSTDGNIYAAVIYDRAAGNRGMSVWDVGCFFTFPESNDFTYGSRTVSLGFFSDLFGHDGVVVSYSAPDPVEAYQRSTIHDYYYFEDANTPVLLARACGTETAVVDLDGDGENELLSDGNQLFFQREGQLYEADVTQLLKDHWPELVWWDYSLIDTSRRCLTVRGFMEMPAWGEGAQCDFVRSVYFDGENLLVYDQLEDTVDHVAESVLSAGVPEQVLADAKAQVQSDFETATSGALEGSIFDQPYDDWRVSYLNLTGTYRDYPTGPIEVYGVGCQFHAADPASVVLAGGMYIQEDGWVGGFYTESSPYLVYEVQTDGSRTRLESHMAGDYSEDSPAYRADLCSTLMENGLVTWADLPGEDLYNMFWMNESAFLNNLAAGADGAAQETALTALVEYGRTFDPTQFQQGLDNLALSSSLTTAGLEAYERLLAIVNGETEPPTEADIHAAILEHRANATAHVFEFAVEAHEVLDQTWEDDTCTVYLMIYFSAYDLTDDGWQLGTDGQFPAAITFAPSDGGWTVQEYWEPLGGAHYAPDLQAKFPPDAYDAVFNDDDLDARLQAQCRAAAEEYMAQHPASSQEEAPVFTKADVEFTGQALSTSTDEMTYEERLTWIQTAEYTPESFYLPLGDVVENQGYLVYTGQWVGTSHTDQYGLNLRFPDGTLASLPLPFASEVAIARPNTMEFTGDTFVYTVTFSSQEVTNEGQSLIHLAGTYRYTVDLTERTVSLTVE